MGAGGRLCFQQVTEATTGLSGGRDLCVCLGRLYVCASSSPHKDVADNFHLVAEKRNKTVCKFKGEPISSPVAIQCTLN